MEEIKAQMLTSQSFKPYGQVVDHLSMEPLVEKPGHTKWWWFPDGSGNLSKLAGEAHMGTVCFFRREFTLDELEHHPNTIQAFINLEGASIAIAAPREVFANGVANLSLIEAFILDGCKTIIYDEGIWHIAPFPITETVTFAVLFKKSYTEERRPISRVRISI